MMTHHDQSGVRDHHDRRLESVRIPYLRLRAGLLLQCYECVASFGASAFTSPCFAIDSIESQDVDDCQARDTVTGRTDLTYAT